MRHFRVALFDVISGTAEEVIEIARAGLVPIFETQPGFVRYEVGVLDALVTEGHSVTYGARFLKRVIDDRLKLPLSQQWKEAMRFRAVLRAGVVAVEPLCLTAADSGAALAV